MAAAAVLAPEQVSMQVPKETILNKYVAVSSCPTLFVLGREAPSKTPEETKNSNNPVRAGKKPKADEDDHIDTFVPMELHTCEVDVHCTAGIAFIDTKMVWKLSQGIFNKKKPKKGFKCVFCVPTSTDTLITEVMAQQGTGDDASCFATMVVENGEIDAMGKKGVMGSKEGKGSKANEDGHTKQKPNPDFFLIRMPNFHTEENIEVTFRQMQPLSFTRNGDFRLDLKMAAPKEISMDGSSDIVYRVLFDTGNQEQVQWNCPSGHFLEVMADTPGSVFLQTTADAPKGAQPNVDFSIGYGGWRESGDIQGAQIWEPPFKNPMEGQDPRGSFAISISPPAPDKHAATFAKRVIFVVDRSGSMRGSPIEAAREALCTALSGLSERDAFNIIAYDDQQIKYSAKLVRARAENIAEAKAWVSENVYARGLTNIMAPLVDAIRSLAPGLVFEVPVIAPESADGIEAPSTEAPEIRPAPKLVVAEEDQNPKKKRKHMPFIFLITDGKVPNEREICKMLQNAVQSADELGEVMPRVNCFGIGYYCNHYFLKMASQIGRGLNGFAFSGDGVGPRMDTLFLSVSEPVLTDVDLMLKDEIDGKKVEYYPNPIPDVYVGKPLVIMGRFEGDQPPRVALRGQMADGAVFDQDIVNGIDVRGVAMGKRPMSEGGKPSGTDASGKTPTPATEEKMKEMKGDEDHPPIAQAMAKNRLDLMTAKAWLDDDAALATQVGKESALHNLPTAHASLLGFSTTKKKLALLKRMRTWSRGQQVAAAAGGVAGVALIAGVGIGFGSLLATGGNLGGLGELFAEIGGELGGELGDIAECCESCDCDCLSNLC